MNWGMRMHVVVGIRVATQKTGEYIYIYILPEKCDANI